MGRKDSVYHCIKKRKRDNSAALKKALEARMRNRLNRIEEAKTFRLEAVPGTSRTSDNTDPVTEAVPKPSQPTPEIKKEIESDNEEEVSSNQYSDYPQTEIALETVKVEYDIDIEDHFSESIAKKQILLDVNLIEDKEKSIIKSEPVDSQLQIEDKGDNYDGFGAYIATLLRALPPKKALAVQPKIVALIVSANIEDHQT